MLLEKKIEKLVKSLRFKKHRYAKGLFVVEGQKSINLLIKSAYNVAVLILNEKYKNIYNSTTTDIYFTPGYTISQLSILKTNTYGIAIAKVQDYSSLKLNDTKISLALDNISDPGNLGTILRIMDWYGITEVLCSTTTVDFYNPKVIQASMGSFINIKHKYCNLETEFKTFKKEIFGGYLTGISIHKIKFPKHGILVIGNESKGISSTFEKYIKKITIPKYGKAESLNASIATAVILDRWIESINN